MLMLDEKVMSRHNLIKKTRDFQGKTATSIYIDIINRLKNVYYGQLTMKRSLICLQFSHWPVSLSRARFMNQSKGRFHLSQPSVVPILTFLSENLGFHKMEKLSGGRGGNIFLQSGTFGKSKETAGGFFLEEVGVWSRFSST